MFKWEEENTRKDNQEERERAAAEGKKEWKEDINTNSQPDPIPYKLPLITLMGQRLRPTHWFSDSSGMAQVCQGKMEMGYEARGIQQIKNGLEFVISFFSLQ